MDYEPFDSSGTDDDLPPSHQNRMARVGRIQGNGRQAAGPAPYPRMYNDTDMEAQIHQLEQEAYSSVLRAFKAQADSISWEQESVITELRKELRLSNEEHRELLARVNADDVIRRIREWRKAGGVQSGMHAAGQGVHDTIPSPTVSASRKKPKMASSVPSQSFGGPSSSFHPQAVSASHQPSPSAAKRGSAMGPKGKKQKPGQPGTSGSKSMPYPSSGPSGRGQVPNKLPSGVALDESLIGRRVRTRWPDDNTFYEAVIMNYNPADGRHVLVYDMGTIKESLEWVNLAEISPEDIQFESEEVGLPRQGGYGGHGVHRSMVRDSMPGVGRGRGMMKGQFRKDLMPSQNGVGRRMPEDIRILHTDSLIKEVERVFNANHPDPIEVEKAKRVLNEHEQALIDAIARIADISDGEIDEGGHHYGQAMGRE